MIAGAIGFVVYALTAPAAMTRWGSLRGSATALAGWFVVACGCLALLALTDAARSTSGALLAGAGAAAPLRHEGQRPDVRCDLTKLDDCSAKDIAVRFAFGAGTSALAGLISALLGSFVAGAFLAFPAILLASLTLVADEEGRSKARDDARGAAGGALGLIAFAIVGAVAFDVMTTPAVLVIATAAWLAVALGAYAIAWRLGYGADERD
jgi:hypothetical protein